MPSLELEVELGAEHGTKPVQGLGGNLHDLSAGLAHEVLMHVLGQVVDGRTVPEVHVIDDSQRLEVVEEAVHRRLGDVGVGTVHLSSELLGSEVVPMQQDGPQDGPPPRRDPAAARPEELEHPIEIRRFRHDRSIAVTEVTATCWH